MAAADGTAAARTGTGAGAGYGAPAGVYERDAEYALLATCITNRLSLLQAVASITPDDFGDVNARVIFRAMYLAVKHGTEVDLITLSDYLAPLDPTGAARAVLLDVMQSPGMASHTNLYIEIIREKARRRYACSLAQDIMSHTSDARYTSDDIAVLLRKGVTRLSERRISFVSADDLVVEPVEWDRQVHRRTGISSLDRLIGGMFPGELWIVAARPGIGKSALTLQMAQYQAQDGVIPFYSLEMTARQLRGRILARAARVSAENIRLGNVSDVERRMIEVAQGKLKGTLKALLIMDNFDMTIEHLIGSLETLAYEHNLSVIYLDYLGLVMVKDTKSEHERLSIISRELKKLAVRLNITIVAVHQLNRAGAARQNDTPVLTDLRGSGSLEQDADLVLFLHEEEMDDETKHYVLIVAKNRSGPTDSVRVNFEKRFLNFF